MLDLRSWDLVDQIAIPTIAIKSSQNFSEGTRARECEDNGNEDELWYVFPMHCLTVVTKSRCLRTALFSYSFHPLSPTSIVPQIQIRTQVTQVTPPKPLKKKQLRKLEELKRKEEEEAKKEITVDSVDWSKVDLSTITIPEPAHPEPQLQYENGRTFHKHPHSYFPS